MGSYIMGIDNGLTSLKVAIFNIDGQEICSQSADTEIVNNGSVYVEKDMEKLWQVTASVIRRTILESGINAEEIVSVGNSAHGNGVYIVDKDGEPLLPAILPMDKRSNHIVDKWKQGNVAESAFDCILQAVWAGQPAPILRWLKENRLDVYEKIGYVMFCKDWLKYRLTGNITTDYSDMSASGLLDNIKKCYSKELLEIYGIEEIYNKLPTIQKSSQICGYVSPKAAAETGLKVRTPVAAGAFDVNACSIGAGVIDDGKYSITAGTWSINCMLKKEFVKSKDILQCTLFADGDKYLCIESSPTSAVNLEWFINNVANADVKLDYRQCDKIAQGFSADDVEVIYLPYLYSPPQMPNIKSGFYDVKITDNLQTMLRSVFEGVAFGHKWHMENLKAISTEADRIRLTGGVSRSEVWCQIFADVLNIPVEITDSKNTGALGAAILAGECAGVYTSLEEAVWQTVKVKKVFYPQNENVIHYNKKFERFKKILKIMSNN